MKLFQRTLWSFVGVIALQAALAGAGALHHLRLHAGRGRRARDVPEASNAYESFNAWKLAFWKDINELAEDARLARAPVGRLVRVLAGLGRRGGARALASPLLVRGKGDGRRDEYAGISRYVVGPSQPKLRRIGSPRPFLLPDQKGASLCRDRLGPRGRSGSSARSGSPRSAAAARRATSGLADICRFLHRAKIDADLVSHLSYDPMVAVAISDARRGAERGRALLGLGRRRQGGQAGPGFREGDRSARRRRTRTACLYRLSAEGLAGRLLLRGRAADGNDRLAGGRAARLPRGRALARRIQRARPTAPARPSSRSPCIVVAFTIIVALVLSRSIVSPIRLLSRATRRIAEGDYRAEVRGPVSGERSASSSTASTAWPGSSRRTSSSSSSTSPRSSGSRRGRTASSSPSARAWP